MNSVVIPNYTMVLTVFLSTNHFRNIGEEIIDLTLSHEIFVVPYGLIKRVTISKLGILEKIFITKLFDNTVWKIQR